MTATAYGNKIIIIGGQIGVGISSDVYMLNVDTGAWSCPIVKGLHFTGHTATLVGDTIFVIVQSSVFALDLHTWRLQECEQTVVHSGYKAVTSWSTQQWRWDRSFTRHIR
jgi:hypothetical protein